jgi:hypothetical protein
MAAMIGQVDGTDAAVRVPMQSGGAGAADRLVPSRIGAREGAGHGSPERVPGAMFRVLALLYLRRHPDVSRGALARELRRRLASGAIHYDPGTLRRQLSGAVSTVPPDIETAMRQILRERDGLAREEELERALATSGIEIPPRDRASAYVMVERILPLAQLWLHLNPGQSKRFLASRLANDLGRKGCRSTIDSLQSVLAGRTRLVRRAVHRVLLGCLAELGVTSEEEASRRARELQQDIQRSLRWRSFVDASRFRQLCRLWQVRRREPSTRRLAVLLKERLSRWGLSANVNHLQTIISGDRRCVRYVFLEAMKDVLREEEIRDLRNVRSPLRAATANEQVEADLRWVPAQPIAALARRWLAAHPGVSPRQLAMRASESLARMGYSSSLNTLQLILGGRQKKTRGFVHRAVLELSDGSAARSPSTGERRRELRRPVWSGATSDGKPSLTWREFVRQVREYLPSARSPHLVPVLAVRAERLYGFPRAKAEARIRGRTWSRRAQTRREAAASSTGCQLSGSCRTATAGWDETMTRSRAVGSGKREGPSHRRLKEGRGGGERMPWRT